MQPVRSAGRSSVKLGRALVGAAIASSVGCAAATPDVDQLRSPIVYGADDRREAFESSPGERALLERSLVALVPKQRLATSEGRVRVMGASLGQAVGLCPGEAFAGQPDAAFCSGVLVDWDLVLTAGHCAHAIAVDDLAVVFGYFYPEPGRLALTADDVY